MSGNKKGKKETFGHKPKVLPGSGHNPRKVSNPKPPKGGTGESSS